MIWRNDIRPSYRDEERYCRMCEHATLPERHTVLLTTVRFQVVLTSRLSSWRLQG